MTPEHGAASAPLVSHPPEVIPGRVSVKQGRKTSKGEKVISAETTDAVRFSEDDLLSFVAELQSQEAMDRAGVLKVLARYPSGDARVLALVEALMEDTTPCQISIPFRYAEIRWLAARALAAERVANGFPDPVRVQNVAGPLAWQDLVDLGKTETEDVRKQVKDILQVFAICRGGD